MGSDARKNTGDERLSGRSRALTGPGGKAMFRQTNGRE